MTLIKNNAESLRAAESIVACCTAQGKAALALIRVSGHDAIAVTAQVAQLASHVPLATVSSHSISYGHIRHKEGHLIDAVLFLVMHAPRTFTGEPVVEITCHNNRFLIEEIIEQLCVAGARRARPGEFTQRAVENGKMDLLQAEGLHDLITAPSRALARASLAQLEGSLSSVVTELEHDLVGLTSFVEASFEFSESEQLDLDFDAAVQERLLQLLERISHMMRTQSQLSHLKEGVRIALVGRVNAGKSTLLNALVGKKRAIVSDRAGTTRDSIEVSMSSGHFSWTFIDTAGLRETDDSIEQEGIERTYEAAQQSDLIMLIIDGGRSVDEHERVLYERLVAQYHDKCMIVYTKSELGIVPLTFDHVPTCLISVAQSQGISELQEFLQNKVASLYSVAETPFLLNQRHSALLADLEKKLQIVENLLVDHVPYELVAIHLHEALQLVLELTGQGVTERVMDTVFSSFCIGK